MTRRTDSKAIVPSVAFVFLALVGCTSSRQEEEPSITTYEDALAHIDELLLPIQNRIGGEWEYLDSGANPCSLADGEGARSVAQRSGPGVEVGEQQALVDDVVTRWTEAGFTPSVSEMSLDGIVVTEVRYPSDGSDENGMSLRFGTATTATVIGGQTRCGTGNAAQINDEYWEQRGE